MRRAAKALKIVLVAGLLSLLALSAQAHPLRWFWRYDPVHFRQNHGWRDHRMLRQDHRAWHARWGDGDRHPNKHGDLHHELVHAERRLHYHRQVKRKSGEASWYDAEGESGACGNELHGMYAAHRRWPCGTLVSVRKGNDHIFVRIRDRGPYANGRIIDLSREAFSRLANPSVGVMDVTIYRLED